MLPFALRRERVKRKTMTGSKLSNYDFVLRSDRRGGEEEEEEEESWWPPFKTRLLSSPSSSPSSSLVRTSRWRVCQLLIGPAPRLTRNNGPLRGRGVG